MKRTVIFLGLIALVIVGLSSCTSMRDCQGRKHTTLSNGIRI